MELSNLFDYIVTVDNHIVHISLTLRRDEGCQSEVVETYGGGRRPKPYDL